MVANTSTKDPNLIHVITDITLTNPGDVFRILYSNNLKPTFPSAIERAHGGGIQVQEPDGSVSNGPLDCIHVTLGPMEVQILGR